MSVTVTERSIDNVANPGYGGDVRVRTNSDSSVTVTWFCGDTRTFNQDDIPTVLTALGTLVDHSDVVLSGNDYRGLKYFVRVVDGVLFADTVGTSLASLDTTDASRGIRAKDLRRALRKAVEGD